MGAVLCFGDSNTWGADPASGERFPPDVRWPGILRRELPAGTTIVEEGLPGRTAASDHPLWPHLSGLSYLLPALESHAPLDVVVIMLGTNDVQERYARSAGTIADDIAGLAEIVARSACGPAGGAPAVLLVAPPPVTELPDPLLAATYGPGVAASRGLAPLLEAAAARAPFRCDFLDAATVAETSRADGIHLDADAHERIGRALAERVRALLAA